MVQAVWANRTGRFILVLVMPPLKETRLWKRALSQREIANNLYATDPHSNALFAYFKFNEGKGDRFTDATGNGNEAWCIDPVEWRDNVRLNANN